MVKRKKKSKSPWKKTMHSFFVFKDVPVDKQTGTALPRNLISSGGGIRQIDTSTL